VRRDRSLKSGVPHVFTWEIGGVIIDVTELYKTSSLTSFFPFQLTNLEAMSLKRKAADLASEAAKKPKQNSYVQHQYLYLILTHPSITSFFGKPKPVPGSAAAAKAAESSKFDKEAWVAKLTDDQKELLKLEIDTLHESWLSQLKDDIVTKEFLDLKRFIKQEISSGKKIFPPMEDVYSWYVSLHAVSKTLFTISHLDYNPNIRSKVTSHSPSHRQSRNPRPGPLSQ
jgi:hypothetical protein